MSFTALTSGEVLAAEPVTATLVDKVRTNLDDHESRLLTIEGGVGTAYPPLIFRVNGYYSAVGTKNGLLKTTLNFPITLTGGRLLIDAAGSSGTTTVDIKFKRGGGAYTSVFSTKPSVAFGAGDDAISSNGILDPTAVDLEAGDILRLDTTTIQAGGRGFLVRIDYNRT